MSNPPEDPRPRPRYGEYATPAEQRARIRQPARPLVPPAPPTGAAEPAGPVRLRPGAAANRIITIALLVYGGINVLLSVFSFTDLPVLADATYRMMGISGTFHDTPTSRLWGVVAAVVLVVGYIATAVLSVWALRRGRRSWWIPLAGAAVTYLAVSVCVAVALAGDPALSSYIQGH